MRFDRLVVILAILVAATVSAPAEEILHFSNGTTMVIRSHDVVDDMLHVDLGSNALIAFPAAQVEKITEAGNDVYLPPSYQRANVGAGGGDVQVSSSGFQAAAPVYGTFSAGTNQVSRSASRRAKKADSIEELMFAEQQAAEHSAPGTIRVMPGASNPTARQLAVTGRVSNMKATPLDGSIKSLPQNAVGEMKLNIPSMMSPSGRAAKGVDVRRFMPSDRAATAAVGAGQPLNLPPPPPPESGSQDQDD